MRAGGKVKNTFILFYLKRKSFQVDSQIVKCGKGFCDESQTIKPHTEISTVQNE